MISCSCSLPFDRLRFAKPELSTERCLFLSLFLNTNNHFSPFPGLRKAQSVKILSKYSQNTMPKDKHTSAARWPFGGKMATDASARLLGGFPGVTRRGHVRCHVRAWRNGRRIGHENMPQRVFGAGFLHSRFPHYLGAWNIRSTFGKNLEEKRQTGCSFSFASFTLLGKIQSVTIDNSNLLTTGLYTYKSMKSVISMSNRWIING